MKVSQKIRYILNAVFGRFTKKASTIISINDALSYDENVTKNRVLYRSQPYELSQLYTQLGSVFKNSFWSKVKKFKRISPLAYGLPKIATDKLAELVSDAYIGITIDNEELNKMWEDIEKDIDIKSLINDITTDLIVDGQVGLFINFDCGVPYFSYKSGDDIDIIYRNGKFIMGKTYERFVKDGVEVYNGIVKGAEFVLETIYEFGSISYNLYDNGGNLVPLSTLDETKDLANITFIKGADKNGNEIIDTNICLFVPVILKKSRQWTNKGQSLFDGKENAFAALDEVNRFKLQQLCRRLFVERGITIVFVTHSIGEAVALADRILVMGRCSGNILADLENRSIKTGKYEDGSVLREEGIKILREKIKNYQ